MRIAVLSTLPPVGGAGGAAWQLTSALTDFGHECSFFILEGSENPLHIPLRDCNAAPWLPVLFRCWSDLTLPEALAANATEFFSDTLTALQVSPPMHEAIRNADVIHLHWVAGMLFSPALLSAIADKKVIWTLHDENAFTGGCHYTGACRGYLSHCCNCPLLKKSGHDDASAYCFHLKNRIYPLLNPFLVSPSAWLAEEVEASSLLGKYPVTVIPNPLDLRIFQPPASRQALRQKLGLQENAFVVLSGCEHLSNPRKNSKAFFAALALLPRQFSDIPMTVVSYGHGQLPELGFPVQHFGHVDNKAAMAELYGAADLYVHTSLQDNLPLSLCEAQACGTPTLSFAVGGCPETMISEETGFLVAEATSQALVEKLRVIIENRDRLAGMRDTARAFAQKRFAPRTVAAAYTEVFEKAQAAPGLQTDDPLFAELLQNQTASLARINEHTVFIRLNETNRRLERIVPRFLLSHLRRIRRFIVNLIYFSI
jgi:glycosyltransferase involved in cell wall biosynthesis